MKKAERINQELIFLRDKSHFQLEDLMTTFAISKRTALRDIAELENLGLPLYVENGRYGGYRLLAQKPLVPIYFTDDEIKALFFALKALSLLSSTPFRHSYSEIRRKLFAIIPAEQQTTITNLLAVIDYHSVPPLNEEQPLDSILTAILAQQILVGRNTQYGDVAVQLQISELFYRNGIWFCSGWDFLTKKWGTYRCDYLLNLTTEETGHQPFTLDELRKLQQTYEITYHDIPFCCRLTNFGKELFLKNHYPNMFLEEEAGHFYLKGGYNQEELGYMTHYLVSLGRHVTVEYPEELKMSLLTELQQIIQSYSS